jgi:hypothetical protein
MMKTECRHCGKIMTVASEVFGQSVTCGSCQKPFVAMVADPPDDIISPEAKAEMDAAWTWFVYRQSLCRSLARSIGFWAFGMVLCTFGLLSDVTLSVFLLWCESTLAALVIIGYQEKKSWPAVLAGSAIAVAGLIGLCCFNRESIIDSLYRYWVAHGLMLAAPVVVSFFPPRSNLEIEDQEAVESEYRQSLSNSLYLSVCIVFFTTLFGYFVILCTGCVNTDAEEWLSFMLALWCGSILASMVVGHAKKRLLPGILVGVFFPCLSLLGTAFIICVLPLPDVSPAVANIGGAILTSAAPFIMSFLPPQRSKPL